MMPRGQPNPFTARALLLAAVVIWGWTFVATKICLDYLSPVELIGLRFLIALPVLLGLILHQRVALTFVERRPSLLMGAALFSLHFALQTTGLQYTSAIQTGWIIAVTPLVLVLLGALVLKERVGRDGWIGTAVAAMGILLLVTHGDLQKLSWLGSTGDWLVLGSAHTWALYTIAIRNLSRSYHPLAVTFVMLLPAATVSLLFMALRSDWRRLAALPGEPLLALLFLGVLGTALAQWFWQEGVARVGAAGAGMFLFLEPVATTALAVPWLHEPLAPPTLVGGGLVLAGVAYTQRRRRV